MATHPVPQALTGKGVVVGDEARHAGRSLQEVARHLLDRGRVAERGAHDAVVMPEGEGAGAGIGLAKGLWIARRLADHEALPVAVEQLPDAVHDAVVLRMALPGQRTVLHQIAHGVEAKTIQATIEPEAQVVLVPGQHLRVAQVEVGHLVREAGEIGTVLVLVPGILAVDAPACGHLILPEVPVPVRAARVRARLLEQRMVGRAVVDHVVHDHADAARVRLLDQLVEVSQRAVVGLDRAVVGHGVAVVLVLAACDRHQPQPRDSQRLQVVEPADQALEVADAVAVAVLVTPDIDLHEGAVPPVRRQRAAARRGRDRLREARELGRRRRCGSGSSRDCERHHGGQAQAAPGVREEMTRVVRLCHGARARWLAYWQGLSARAAWASARL